MVVSLNTPLRWKPSLLSGEKFTKNNTILQKKPPSVRADYKVTSGTMLSPLQATKYSPAPTRPHQGHMKGRCRPLQATKYSPSPTRPHQGHMKGCCSCSKLSQKFGKQSHLTQYDTSSPGKPGNIAGTAEQKPPPHRSPD